MPLFTLRDLSIGFRGPVLLDGVSCQIESRERIGLLGRNGSGKTTLMRILHGDVDPDGGEVQFAPGTKVALLPQEVPQGLRGSVAEIVAQGLSSRLANAEATDHETAWRDEQSVKQILSRMELDGEAEFDALSSGMKRRVLLAQAIVCSPDLLLLDEPTNHLDIDAITWLEDFLSRFPATFMFVTHDRMFLRKLAGRILEIDRGHLFDWSCDYDTFLSRKEGELAAEEKHNALFDKKLAEEEVWIRTGIKARRTRNEGRVRALEAMRRVRQERRSSPGKMQLAIQEGERSGALVAEIKNVSFAYDQRPIVRDFSTTIMRGDKIGIIGPNGAGKTTLLRLLLGRLTPQEGTVRLGSNLQIAYFDQLREQLDDEASVQDNVVDGSDSVTVNGQKRHVIGYLRDFLFSPERARTPVRFLSGGERNRLLLARLFSKTANVIVLDEPTNDLDAETLELLEARLVEFDGTMLVVSHDREFLNNVVSSTIAHEGSTWREYVGGYDDWLRQRRCETEAAADKPRSSTQRPAGEGRAAVAIADRKQRLSYNEQRELTTLPGAIERLEADIGAAHHAMAQPDFYQQPGNRIAEEQQRLKSLDEQLSAAYQRWQELEARVE
ncbi:MAG: ATP-binding cassette domain-containing protein [Pirellulales bacterium]